MCRPAVVVKQLCDKFLIKAKGLLWAFTHLVKAYADWIGTHRGRCCDCVEQLQAAESSSEILRRQ